jgi:hypothetical protein
MGRNEKNYICGQIVGDNYNEIKAFWVPGPAVRADVVDDDVDVLLLGVVVGDEDGLMLAQPLRRQR